MAFANIITDLSGGGPNLLTADLVQLGLIAPQWGIFDKSGRSVVTADSVLNVEYKQDWRISDYPLEQGAFESYNKVNTPFDARVTFVTGGSFANRQAMLASIAAIAGDLKLYSVVTPEATYPSVNINHYDYSRAEGAIGLIKVGVWVTQINISTGSTLSNTQQPSGAAPANQGQVQPEAPNAAQASAANSVQTSAAIRAGA